MTESLAITGATGFIGSAVARAASSEPVRLLVREGQSNFDARLIVGDLRDRITLRELVEGVHTVVHCASYVGHDQELANEVNDVGTRSLVAASLAAGVQRIIYVSTTGVYGTGPFSDADETTPRDPVSVTSRSRARAEDRILDAGGLVIRPHLVVGVGDRRVLPLLPSLVQAAQGVPAPAARASVIDVDELARQVWSLAASPHTSRAFNAQHGAAISLRDLYDEMVLHGLIASAPDISADAALTRLREMGIGEHQAQMLSNDATFTSSLPAASKSPSVPLSAASLGWYESTILTERRVKL
ncbi:NAD-dependent epimerase/dehydratase family protein [Microbacterium sp. NPDC058389]|uniref:NAD-dependent epimerase/dehydratase family protein n=1 Tax=Microbacterium sp. NPDC058389 TaxID=3346475 RepID=UPI003652159D